jgi:hypothetical protein
MLSWAGIVLAAFLNRSFAVPFKTARLRRFSRVWIPHSLFIMCVIPWVVVMVAVPWCNDLLTRVALRGWLILVG